MLTKNKLSSNLREQLLKQQEEKSSNKNDPRYLNYFDLKMGESMEILLIPDDAGQLYYEYSSHAVNRSGVPTINCSYTSSKESCAVCTYGYGIYQETGNKDESQIWRKKTHYISQCIVLKSPIEVNEAEDGNLVKLFHMPFSIQEMIVDGLINGTVPNPDARVLVLKKTKKNPNSDYASYGKSYFKNEADSEIPPEFIEAYESGLIRPYDLKAEIPAPTHEADMVEWLEKALKATPFKSSAKAGGNAQSQEASEEAGVQETAAPQRTGTIATDAPKQQPGGLSLKERLAARRNSAG